MAWLAHLRCRLFGHQRKHYIYDSYRDSRGRWREKRSCRCIRCGTGQPDCYAHPIFTLTPLRRWWREIRRRFTRWGRTDCVDCRKPLTHFERPVGEHRNCDHDIPF